VIARDGTILYASSGTLDLVGAPPEHYIGRNIIDVLAPESRDRAIEAFQDFTMPDRPTTGWTGPALTIRLQHVGGHSVPCRALAVPSGRPEFDGLVLQIRGTETNDKLDTAIASMAGGDEIETTIRSILDFASEQMPQSIGVVGLGYDGQRFRSVVADPRAPGLGDESLALGVDASPWQIVLDGAESAAMDCDDLAEPLRTVAIRAGLSACWAYSLNRTTRGHDVVVFWRRAPGRPGPHLTEAIRRNMRLIQLALDADRSRQALERQASTDELTGLANRSVFFERLDALSDASPSARFGLLYCDLDDFKRVNDQLGHIVGDRVLEVAARRIESQIRSGDLTARIGGDEFAVLSTGTDRGELDRLAERLVEAFDPPISVDGVEIELGISVGATLVDPASETIDAAQVLHRADQAMLRAKAAGTRGWRTADPLEPPL
jgi:diguanylate cyclase (GGDEF)-like protein